MPATTAAAASRKEPLWRNTVAAMKAPIMYSEPCARLMKFMMPNQRQAGGQQEKQDTQLQAVQGLHQQQRRGHGALPRSCLWGGVTSSRIARRIVGDLGQVGEDRPVDEADLAVRAAATSARKKPAAGK